MFIFCHRHRYDYRRHRMNGKYLHHRCCKTSANCRCFRWNNCCAMKKSDCCYYYKKNDCCSNFWRLNCYDKHLFRPLLPCADKKNRNGSPYCGYCSDVRKKSPFPETDECKRCWNEHRWFPYCSQPYCYALLPLNVADEPMQNHP